MDMINHRDDDNITGDSNIDNESVADSGIHHKPGQDEPEPVAEGTAEDANNGVVEDEFIDEDDLGFNFISISPAKARMASLKLAEEYN